MKICKKLKETIKQKPFFDCVGGCGVDLSNGESNCMQKDGVWFEFCPFCGKKIFSRFQDSKWSWYEE